MTQQKHQFDRKQFPSLIIIPILPVRAHEYVPNLFEFLADAGVE